MRLRKITNSITLNVVVGTSAVLFSIDMKEEDTSDLLGFYIRKTNLKKPKNTYDVSSIKRFPNATRSPGGRYSTKEHPWQSFLWEDFYVSDRAHYEYSFTPVTGTPENLKYGDVISIQIKIPSASEGQHEVHFNRGVAASQAYAREFNNVKPSDMPDEQRAKVLKWLSKGLNEALTGFIDQANTSQFELRACFYEFIYPEVLQALKTAAEKCKDVKIIYDSRHEAVKNDAAIAGAGLDRKNLIKRSADPKYLQHNKYMILLKDGEPVEVWTGSTNITEKAIFGHCNVGHIIRDKSVAAQYLNHWEGLSKDPVNKNARTNSISIQQDVITIEKGMTVFFSPRPKTNILSLYSKLIDGSEQLVCGMFPFSFFKGIKDSITADTDHLKYVIMDKKTKNTTLTSNDFDNVIVYGGKYDSPLYEWAEEVTSGELFYNGVNFIHNKVILIDPLTESPIVITGSANFSNNSILRNDENTIVIKGNKEVADLYFTEFSRIFNHYSTRQDTKKLTAANAVTGYNPSHLRISAADWVPAFFKGTGLKCKRRKMFTQMNAILIP